VVDFTRFIAVTFHHQNLVKNIIFLYAIVVHNFRVSDGKNIAVSTSQIIQMSALSKKNIEGRNKFFNVGKLTKKM
jgi:hypothetical protein